MAEKSFDIGLKKLSIQDIEEISIDRRKISITKASLKKVKECRKFLDDEIVRAEKPIYGVNTGFGSLCNTVVPPSELEKLQYNLVVSHACGMGEEVPREIVELMVLLKIKSLCLGHSGIDSKTLSRLVDFYNYEITPVIYELGSLGASGDLAPLAHLSLPLIGKGEVYFNGKRIHGIKLDELFNWKPLKLKAKEGLALLNGTQFMSAYAVHLLIKMRRLMALGDLISAISMESFLCQSDFLNSLVHEVRPHSGQTETAETIRKCLKGSELQKVARTEVQDPYSFRCVPQVHGASKDALRNIENIVETEINSVTDNPTIFPEEGKIISAGNFHGQPLAIHLDFLSIAAAELGSISERRIYKLISGQRGLPACLIQNPGLHSGFMIAQYTAASIVSQSKQLSMPSSVDTIDSSAGQEDHVSMGANSATNALRVVENYEKILSIELMCAMQALEFRGEEKTSPIIRQLFKDFRNDIEFIEEDAEMYKLMHKSQEFIQEIELSEYFK